MIDSGHVPLGYRNSARINGRVINYVAVYDGGNDCTRCLAGQNGSCGPFCGELPKCHARSPHNKNKREPYLFIEVSN